MLPDTDSWLWGSQSSQFFDCIGSPEQVFQRKRCPWECFECPARFKWDMQLLRHERQTGHQNPNREIRRKQKYQKAESRIIKCTLCNSSFSCPLQRLQHKRWCPNDPKTQKLREIYRSSLEGYLYECRQHQVSHYFSDLLQLQSHIKTHKKIGQKQIPQINKIFQWKKKWNCTGLTNQQYKEIIEKFGIKISFATLRRMFKKA